MNDKLKSAIIGGVVLGLLSAIPFVNFVNACCCAWAIAGGALAVYLYIQKSSHAVSVGEGAGIGAIAGAVGAIINLIIGIPLQLITGSAMTSIVTNLMARANPQGADIIRQQIEIQQNLGFGERLLLAIPGALIGFVLILIFATIGGMIAVPIFEKRKGGPGAPPPPQGFGGQPSYNPPPPQNYGQPGGGYGA
jgi:hypothetical protein